MAGRPKRPVARSSTEADLRRVRGRAREDAAFPATPPLSGLPRDYAADEHDLRPFVEEQPRAGQSDTAGAAGDHADLAVQQSQPGQALRVITRPGSAPV